MIHTYLITGFLGAGKTTALNQMWKQFDQDHTIVIENEFGEIGVDGNLLDMSDEKYREIADGCICCSSNEALYDVLYDIKKHEKGYKTVLIETTGIADPCTVADVFFYPKVKTDYKLMSCICVVDAQFIEEELAESKESREQITFSDILLLNKCDLISKEKQQFLEEMLHRINPFARIFTGNKGDFDWQQILSLSTFDRQQTQADIEAVVATHHDTHICTPNCSHEHHDYSHDTGVTHKHDIVSYAFSIPGVCNLNLFRYMVAILLNVNGHQFYRIKGILADEDDPRKVIVQSVRNNLNIDYGAPWQPEEVKENKLVFIGKGIKREAIERFIKQAFEKETA